MNGDCEYWVKIYVSLIGAFISTNEWVDLKSIVFAVMNFNDASYDSFAIYEQIMWTLWNTYKFRYIRKMNDLSKQTKWHVVSWQIDLPSLHFSIPTWNRFFYKSNSVGGCRVAPVIFNKC